MSLSVISPIYKGVHDWWMPSKKSQPPIVERISLAACRAVYAVVDALDRVRGTSDGLDKTLKLLVSSAYGMLLVPGANQKYWGWLSSELRYIDKVFSGIAVFGRWNALTEIDPKTGKPKIVDKGPCKVANTALLSIAKTFEFCSLMQTIGFISNDMLTNMDVRFLGGAAARLGNWSVIGRVGYNAGLTQCKNNFLIGASVYSIIDNTIVLFDWKKEATELQKAALSIGADFGKIYLAGVAFPVAMTTTYVLVAFLTAALSLTKIILDDYTKPGKGIQYPAWMRA